MKIRNFQPRESQESVMKILNSESERITRRISSQNFLSSASEAEQVHGKGENCNINSGNYFLFTAEHTFVTL